LFFFNKELVLGQNKYINIGVRGNGFALGNPKKYNGLKMNLWDKNIDRFNGIQFGLWNIAKNNKHFKRLPLMNINLKSKRKDTE
jgi:hypothetical protein